MQDKIKQIIDRALANNVFGSNFTFRPGQREAIEQITNLYFEQPEAKVIVDAPTGIGKSFIAIWCAYIFKELSYQGYIITSELNLQDQYEKDFTRLGLNWPSIKGADNYKCDINNLPFSLGDCSIKGLTMAETKNLECYPTCDYLQKKEQAQDQPVGLFNYSYWLIQRNYVARKRREEGYSEGFKQRDFIFFDEAHKIDQIVQGHFAPTLSTTFPEKIKMLNGEFTNRGLTKHLPGKLIQPSSFEFLYRTINHAEDNETILNALKTYSQYLATYNTFKKPLTQLNKKQAYNKTTPQYMQRIFNLLDQVKDLACKIEDYIEIIEAEGSDTMILERESASDGSSNQQIKLMCVHEASMIQKFLHDQAGFEVFMSATIGDPNVYAKTMGIDNAKVIRLNNQFDYSRSPIIFINKYKLNYKQRDQNIPLNINILDQILRRHEREKGIMHTGSHYITDKVVKGSEYSAKILSYKNSKQKEQALDDFKNSADGKILVGPSLLEGLDLQNEVSRFQIFFKVPYPSLASPLTKAKLQQIAGWYDWKTICNIMQGLGRSIRNEEDWAVTYVIDACFNALIYNNKLPKSLNDRLKIYNP